MCTRGSVGAGTLSGSIDAGRTKATVCEPDGPGEVMTGAVMAIVVPDCCSTGAVIAMLLFGWFWPVM